MTKKEYLEILKGSIKEGFIQFKDKGDAEGALDYIKDGLIDEMFQTYDDSVQDYSRDNWEDMKDNWEAFN